jgi:hypothetical protein
MKESYKVFYSKFCKCQLKNGFFIYGVVTDINNKGVFINSKTKPSFICWDAILELIPTIEKVS